MSAVRLLQNMNMKQDLRYAHLGASTFQRSRAENEEYLESVPDATPSHHRVLDTPLFFSSTSSSTAASSTSTAPSSRSSSSTVSSTSLLYASSLSSLPRSLLLARRRSSLSPTCDDCYDETKRDERKDKKEKRKEKKAEHERSVVYTLERLWSYTLSIEREREREKNKYRRLLPSTHTRTIHGGDHRRRTTRRSRARETLL